MQEDAHAIWMASQNVRATATDNHGRTFPGDAQDDPAFRLEQLMVRRRQRLRLDVGVRGGGVRPDKGLPEGELFFIARGQILFQHRKMLCRQADDFAVRVKNVQAFCQLLPDITATGAELSTDGNDQRRCVLHAASPVSFTLRRCAGPVRNQPCGSCVCKRFSFLPSRT
ncbi:MAG: hypothetical protein BWX45_00871 [Deltaproteobacteria bacterium ADurb.Bin002]|nr:MAG: hypothetical protein BWX45_00871 [Deltaproteobacteria bacterium ADurb.Bin002]